eukprot:6208412-Pleurochrysis_carterae.AAC.2
MHINAAGGDNNSDNADNNDMIDDNATLFALYKAFGLPTSLKSDILYYNCFRWRHVTTTRAASLFTRMLSRGDCIDGLCFFKLRGSSRERHPDPASGGSKFKKQHFKRFKFKSITSL